MKTFNEQQMADPWAWCQHIIREHDIPAPRMSEATGCPASTMRALYAGKNQNPRYELLTKIIAVCIRVANGEDVFGEAKAEAAEPAWLHDFLGPEGTESAPEGTSEAVSIEAFL